MSFTIELGLATCYARYPSMFQGERGILESLANIHPAERDEKFRRFCRFHKIQIKLEDDFSDYKDEDEENQIGAMANEKYPLREQEDQRRWYYCMQTRKELQGRIANQWRTMYIVSNEEAQRRKKEWNRLITTLLLLQLQQVRRLLPNTRDISYSNTTQS